MRRELPPDASWIERWWDDRVRWLGEQFKRSRQAVLVHDGAGMLMLAIDAGKAGF